MEPKPMTPRARKNLRAFQDAVEASVAGALGMGPKPKRPAKAPPKTPEPPKPAPVKKANTGLAVERLHSAQEKMETWERRLARAAKQVVKLRSEVRRRWKKLEEEGVQLDPMFPGS